MPMSAADRSFAQVASHSRTTLGEETLSRRHPSPEQLLVDLMGVVVLDDVRTTLTEELGIDPDVTLVGRGMSHDRARVRTTRSAPDNPSATFVGSVARTAPVVPPAAAIAFATVTFTPGSPTTNVRTEAVAFSAVSASAAITDVSSGFTDPHIAAGP